jgi:hypothetical protein
VSKESEGPQGTSDTSAPGAGAGEAAPTQHVPRIPKPEVKGAAKPPTSRPVTASEYAKTTSQSPDRTSVIPAVKDAPKASSKPAASVAASAPAGGGRQASLKLRHIDPWSVARLTFCVSVALMVVAVVAAAVFWLVSNVIGVWDQINDALTTVLSDESTPFDLTDYFGFGRTVGFTLVLSAINVVLMTIFATVGAHLYNLAAQLMGGVEVTLSEDK